MNILMISPQFKPLVGGYEQAAERLSIALMERGHKVTIMAEQQQREWPKAENLNGVNVRRWWCIYQPGQHMLTSLLGLAIMLLYTGRQYQVWHVHQYGMHAALTIAIGKLIRRPVVFKLTSSSYMGLNAVVSQGKFPKIIKWLHCQVDGVVALTRETFAEAEAFGIQRNRIHVLGNGVDINEFRPRSESDRKKLKNKMGLNGRFVLIYVGRFSEEKNVESLLRAWSIAIQKIQKKSILVLVGFGPLLEKLEELATKLNMIDVVSFVGQQTNVSDWLAVADLYVQSSKREGLSNTMIEAMATGLPVVVTRVSGTEELVEEQSAGIVVPIDNIDALSEAIVKMASADILRRECGLMCRRIVEEKLSIQKIVFSYEKLYKSLI